MFILKFSVFLLNFLVILGQNENKTVYTKDFLKAAPAVNFSLANAQPTDVSYYLFTSQDQKDWTVLTKETVKSAKFDRNLPTKLFIHGFTTDETSPWYPITRDEYFKKGPHNILYIDWSKAGNLTFAESSANVDPVGKFMAEFLINSQIPAYNLHVIGHSLGSQLAGFIGKHYFQKTGMKIGRITGLDTAGPAFHKHPENLRLCPEDADFVDSVHTDIGYFGYSAPHAHVDFYPNFGKNQPGCKPEDENCSHARSTIFFAESINKQIKAVEVEFLSEDEIKVIKNGRVIIFGDATPTNSRGSYYFRTSSSLPYLSR